MTRRCAVCAVCAVCASIARAFTILDAATAAAAASARGWADRQLLLKSVCAVGGDQQKQIYRSYGSGSPSRQWRCLVSHSPQHHRPAPANSALWRSRRGRLRRLLLLLPLYSFPRSFAQRSARACRLLTLHFSSGKSDPCRELSTVRVRTEFQARFDRKICWPGRTPAACRLWRRDDRAGDALVQHLFVVRWSIHDGLLHQAAWCGLIVSQSQGKTERHGACIHGKRMWEKHSNALMPHRHAPSAAALAPRPRGPSGKSRP